MSDNLIGEKVMFKKVGLFLLSLCMVLVSVSFVRAASVVDEMISAKGKDALVNVIRAYRQNRVTVLLDGVLTDRFGPQDVQYVNAATIREDLKKMKVSEDQFKKIVDGNIMPAQVEFDSNPFQSYASNASIIIPGNHPKSSGKSKDSYVDPCQELRNLDNLYREADRSRSKMSHSESFAAMKRNRG